MSRAGCPSDAGDEDRAVAAPYLTLMKEDAPQRSHDLREVFNGLRWLVRTGAERFSALASRLSAGAAFGGDC